MEKISIARRPLLSLTAVALLTMPFALEAASAQTADVSDATTPVRRLEGALLAAMKSGRQTPFSQRFATLAPVVDETFDLSAVLQAAIGLGWATLPPDQMASLQAAFRRYTISSYVSNFDDYSGQTFRISPNVRSVGNGRVVVQSYIVPKDDTPKELSYVMKQMPGSWRAVDVLADGSISQVAVQRSDFRSLLVRGGAPALLGSLQRKVSDLSGGALA
jgi:phospholipid transport system substrate-binding protein